MEKKQNTVRRDKLVSLESRARYIWNRYNYFTVEPIEGKKKYFQTFPFPYMNGNLHLGHAFSMTKCDFNAWYKRLQGFNVLFPFAFHCTGMPMEAASRKLKSELETYGEEPKFPEKKKDDPMFQYEIMVQLGIPKKEIPEFKVPSYWTTFFPPLAKQHIQRFGSHVDIGRSFITTENNPYYDSFIRWQFNTLKAKNYLKFGKRPTIYSPKDKQICADHDRSSGEGINPDQYTLVKLELLKKTEKMIELFGEKKVFLPAATLRPETMYGQTSCFLLPEGNYVAIEMKNDEIFICGQRSARNMAYQNLTKQPETYKVLLELKGKELMGLPLSAPLAVHKVIYLLPMMTIHMDKGTGVVTCVPSDSPDDWMAMSDLRNKKAFRDKFGISEEMVNLEAVQVLEVNGYDGMMAQIVCERMKIQSQNDRELLDLAKDECYKKGFHDGKMSIGNFKGTKVLDAKNLIKKEMVDQNQALQYYEPGGKVISRSGEECVVSYCDQWYINYADEDWKKRVQNFAEKTMEFNNENLRSEIVYAINWLREWGCSRSFGMGTKLPFDEQYVIESLSDSTIYFAYYTICHYLQGDISGSQPGVLGIKPADITHDFWDYVYLGKEYISNKVPLSKLDQMRESFLYWYPMDLRCSAKDLIKNHLTMALFNHAAIWDDEKFWPRKFFCNGYINVDGQKMSKSLGNFITLIQAVDEYGADSSRLACAQAGDTINDANFTKENANSAIMQLSTLEMYLVKAGEHRQNIRNDATKQYEYIDSIFENVIEDQILKVKEAYESMIYRDVVKYGFHDFTSLKDIYYLRCNNNPRADLVQRYIYLQLLFLYPICPHFCEVAYLDYFLTFAKSPKKYPTLLGECRFPAPVIEINQSIIKSHVYFERFLGTVRDTLTKQSKPRKNQGVPKFTKATILYREEFMKYQQETLTLLKSTVVNGEIRPDWRTLVKIENAEERTKALKFGGFIQKQYKVIGADVFDLTLSFNEMDVIRQLESVIQKDFPFKLEFVELSKIEEEKKEYNYEVTPGNPVILFSE